MVTKAELVAVSKKEGIPLGTVEKDYILTYTLKKIYNSDLKESLVFKGGTALHKLYLHKRISVDLDFTSLRRIEPDDLKRVIEDKEIQSKIKDINDIGNSTRVILGYVSALEFANRIFLDISKREKPVLSLARKSIYSSFFEEFDVLTFELDELLAEKIRALNQRKKPRDYLDLYYIAESGKANFATAVEIAKKKLSAFKEEFDKKRILDDTELVQTLWEQGLRGIFPSAPRFDEVMNKIRDVFAPL